MKRLCLLLAALLAGINAIIASEKIDSLSYALGNKYTLSAKAENSDLMQGDSDFKEYLRGFEGYIHQVERMNDSAYRVSYALGAMDAIFKTDGMRHLEKEDLPPVPCIVAGLRKVADGDISLPADTVAAMDIIKRYRNKDVNPAELDKDSLCMFFTAYGIMKAYQPGLQQYIDGLPTKGCKENRQAFATGMADMYELFMNNPETAHDLGRSIAMSVNIGLMEGSTADAASVLAGAKAALGLAEQIISPEEVEEVLSRPRVQEQVETYPVEQDSDLAKLKESIDKLDVELDTQYSVDWNVTAGDLADAGSEAYNAFLDVVSTLNIKDEVICGIPMAKPLDSDGVIYETALVIINNYPLPEGCKWFCRRNGGETMIGVMQSEPSFSARLRFAAVDFDPMSAKINVFWTFEEADVLKWAEFTEAHIGRHVAVEIDGEIMFAPMVNSQIEGGHCAISGLAPEEVNRLFKNARKVTDETPVGTTE